MPVFKVDVEKFAGGEFWSNRYFVDAAVLSNAAQMALDIVATERTFHLASVLFTKFVASDLAEGTDQFISVPINLNGQRTLSNDALPLFCIVRTLLTAGVGRTPFKQYRGVLMEGDIAGGTVASGLLNDINTAFNNLITLGNVVLCDQSGTPITSANSSPRVWSRQLRRGTRRRATPILP